MKSDTSPETGSAEPFLVLLIFSSIGLAISLLAVRYGLDLRVETLPSAPTVRRMMPGSAARRCG
jgi:hypothetical protein